MDQARCTVTRSQCRHTVGAGFTLVELLVTLAVAAILAAIAVPGFQHLMAENNLNTTANAIVTALDTARSEAIKRGNTAQFCSDASSKNGTGTLGRACDTQTAAVYVLVNAVAKQVLAARNIAQGGLRVVGHVTALQFDDQGLAHAVGATGPYTGDIAQICATAISSDNRRVITMATGSTIQVKTTQGGCP